MELIVQILILTVGFIMLIKGADFFVDGSSSIASKLKIPQMIIGLTIVAMGTSAPEAAVSIAAALNNNADITIGNIVGSNILNILIILGISSLIVPLAVNKASILIDIPITIGVTCLLLLLGFDGTISFIDGIIFWIAFIIYLAYLFISSKNNKSEENFDKNQSIFKSCIFTILGLGLIIVGSNFTVDAATIIAQKIGISQRFIGLTIVALGTSLPELFTSVLAAKKGNADIAIGNIIGSNIFNILFVVGTSSLITPVNFASSFRIDTIIAIAAAVLLLLCSLPKKQLNRASGIIMLICYGGYFLYLC